MSQESQTMHVRGLFLNFPVHVMSLGSTVVRNENGLARNWTKMVRIYSGVLYSDCFSPFYSSLFVLFTVFHFNVINHIYSTCKAANQLDWIHAASKLYGIEQQRKFFHAMKRTGQDDASVVPSNLNHSGIVGF